MNIWQWMITSFDKKHYGIFNEMIYNNLIIDNPLEQLTELMLQCHWPEDEHDLLKIIENSRDFMLGLTIDVDLTRINMLDYHDDIILELEKYMKWFKSGTHIDLFDGFIFLLDKYLMSIGYSHLCILELDNKQLQNIILNQSPRLAPILEYYRKPLSVVSSFALYHATRSHPILITQRNFIENHISNAWKDVLYHDYDKKYHDIITYFYSMSHFKSQRKATHIKGLDIILLTYRHLELQNYNERVHNDYKYKLFTQSMESICGLMVIVEESIPYNLASYLLFGTHGQYGPLIRSHLERIANKTMFNKKELTHECITIEQIEQRIEFMKGINFTIDEMNYHISQLQKQLHDVLFKRFLGIFGINLNKTDENPLDLIYKKHAIKPKKLNLTPDYSAFNKILNSILIIEFGCTYSDNVKNYSKTKIMKYKDIYKKVKQYYNK